MHHFELTQLKNVGPVIRKQEIFKINILLENQLFSDFPITIIKKKKKPPKIMHIYGDIMHKYGEATHTHQVIKMFINFVYYLFALSDEHFLFITKMCESFTNPRI